MHIIAKQHLSYGLPTMIVYKRFKEIVLSKTIKIPLHKITSAILRIQQLLQKPLSLLLPCHQCPAASALPPVPCLHTTLPPVPYLQCPASSALPPVPCIQCIAASDLPPVP